MKRRLMVLLALFAMSAVALPVALRLAPASHRLQKTKKTPLSDLPAWAPARGTPDRYEAVTLTITIPAASELPGPIAASFGCPQQQLASVLGVAVTPGQGCVVVHLEEDGPAAMAGVRLGDRMSDSPDDCPSAIAGSFRPGEHARDLTWTVQRPVIAPIETPAPKASAEEGPP
jgi:hypothetical protein